MSLSSSMQGGGEPASPHVRAHTALRPALPSSPQDKSASGAHFPPGSSYFPPELPGNGGVWQLSVQGSLVQAQSTKDSEQRPSEFRNSNDNGSLKGPVLRGSHQLTLTQRGAVCAGRPSRLLGLVLVLFAQMAMVGQAGASSEMPTASPGDSEPVSIAAALAALSPHKLLLFLVVVLIVACFKLPTFRTYTRTALLRFLSRCVGGLGYGWSLVVVLRLVWPAYAYFQASANWDSWAIPLLDGFTYMTTGKDFPARMYTETKSRIQGAGGISPILMAFPRLVAATSLVVIFAFWDSFVVVEQDKGMEEWWGFVTKSIL